MTTMDAQVGDMKKCPFCAEEIKADAIKCKHCGSMLDGSTSGQPAQPTTQTTLLYESQKKSGPLAAALNLIFPGAGYFYCGNYVLGLVAFLFVLCSALALGYGMAFFYLVFIVDGFLCADRYNKNLLKRLTTSSQAAQPA